MIHNKRVPLWLMMFAVLALLPAAIRAQETDPGPLGQAREAFRQALEQVMIPKSRLTDGSQVRAAFHDVIGAARQATVEIRSQGKRVALGGIVGSDGWVLTKASQVHAPLTCRLDDGRELDARLVGVDRDFDLAMLKFDAKGLPVLNLKRDDDSDVGDWVATVALEENPVAVGVVSVDTRQIRRRGGWLGIGMDQVKEGPRITQVYPSSGAAIAGVLVNDLIIAVNGKPTPTIERLRRRVKQFSPGEVIELKIRRADEELTLRAELASRVKGMPTDRRDIQDRLGSELSERRFGFPRAFQHDTVLRPIDCGGPLVDLEGRVVGFNISRAGRTESYAIPSNVLVTRLYDLMSGNLAPAEDDQAKVEQVDESPPEDEQPEDETKRSE